MRRSWLWIAAVGGTLWTCGSLLVAAAAFSDGHYYRCPGIQCSDAMVSGIVYTVSASIGLFLVLMSAVRLRSRALSSSSAEFENELP